MIILIMITIHIVMTIQRLTAFSLLHYLTALNFIYFVIFNGDFNVLLL